MIIWGNYMTVNVLDRACVKVRGQNVGQLRWEVGESVARQDT